MAEESAWALKLSDVVLAVCTILGPVLGSKVCGAWPRANGSEDDDLPHPHGNEGF
jgi:hypothetical protein